MENMERSQLPSLRRLFLFLDELIYTKETCQAYRIYQAMVVAPLISAI